VNGSGSGGFFPSKESREGRQRPTDGPARGSQCEKTSSYLLDMVMSIG